MFQVFVNDSPGAKGVPSGMVISLTKAELSHTGIFGIGERVALGDRMLVRVRVGLVCGTGLKVDNKVGVKGADAVWAAKMVFATAVYVAALSDALALQALSISARIKTKRASG
jgi:hypothetical protein